MNDFSSPSYSVVRTPKPWWRRWWGITLLFILSGVVFFMLAVGSRIYARLFTRGSIQQNQNSFSQSSLPPAVSARDAEKLIRSDSPAVGRVDAPVTIVEFGDFQCPFCKESFPVIRSLMAQYPNDLRFVYRQFPVASIHPDATLAAEASMCAAEQDKFLAYHDRLFLNQPALDETSLLLYARQVGADSQRFVTCLSSRRYKNFVERDIADGTALGVAGTPTWFINGHKIAGAIPKELFQQVVDSLLTSTKQ